MKKSNIHPSIPLSGQSLSENASTRTKGILLMLGAVAAFTVSVLMLRSAGIAGSIWIATCMRYGIGLTIVTVIYLPKGQFKPLQLIRNPDLMMRGILGCMGVYLFYATIPKLGAGVSTFIGTTYVVIAPLIACIYLKEQLTDRSHHAAEQHSGYVGRFDLFCSLLKQGRSAADQQSEKALRGIDG